MTEQQFAALAYWISARAELATVDHADTARYANCHRVASEAHKIAREALVDAPPSKPEPPEIGLIRERLHFCGFIADGSTVMLRARDVLVLLREYDRLRLEVGR